MPTMNISLPDPMKKFVEEQVASGGYSTVSEYMRELVRSDQTRKAKEKVEALLLEALHSPTEEVTPQYWEELKQAALERVRTRKKQAS